VEGEVIDQVNFDLIPGGVITGRVTLPNGQPAIEASVWIDPEGRPFFRRDKATGTLHASEKTDDQGNYRFYGLAPDRYIIRAYLAGSPKSAFYHPDPDDPQKAGVISVSRGQEVTGVDVVIGAMPRNYQAVGVGVDDNGNPVPNIPYAGYDVVANDRINTIGGQNTSNWTDNQGQFRLNGLTPGKHAVAVVSGAGSSLCSEPLYFDVDSVDVTGLRLQVHPGASVSGNAVIEDTGDPSALSQLGDQRLMVSSGAIINNFMGQDVPLAGDGSFFVSGLGSGSLRISVDSPEGTKSFAVGRIELNGAPLPEGFSLTAGQQVSGLTVILVPSSGSIRGQVIAQGASIVGSRVFVVAFPVSGPQRAAAGDLADVQGRFEIHGLRDGQYWISAYCLVCAPAQNHAERVLVNVSGGQAPETNITLKLTVKQ
ncbi:MAG TPA: carboxypeptidase-like regulatory domain-containing protein, partial [Blastocatellia bacterium]